MKEKKIRKIILELLNGPMSIPVNDELGGGSAIKDAKDIDIIERNKKIEEIGIPEYVLDDVYKFQEVMKRVLVYRSLSNYFKGLVLNPSSLSFLDVGKTELIPAEFLSLPYDKNSSGKYMEVELDWITNKLKDTSPFPNTTLLGGVLSAGYIADSISLQLITDSNLNQYNITAGPYDSNTVASLSFSNDLPSEIISDMPVWSSKRLNATTYLMKGFKFDTVNIIKSFQDYALNMWDTALSPKNLKNAESLASYMRRERSGRAYDSSGNSFKTFGWYFVTGGILDIEEDSKFYEVKGQEINKSLYSAWTLGDATAMWIDLVGTTIAIGSASRGLGKYFLAALPILYVGTALYLWIDAGIISDVKVSEMEKIKKSFENIFSEILKTIENKINSDSSLLSEIINSGGDENILSSIIKRETIKISRTINLKLADIQYRQEKKVYNAIQDVFNWDADFLEDLDIDSFEDMQETISGMLGQGDNGEWQQRLGGSDESQILIDKLFSKSSSNDFLTYYQIMEDEKLDKSDFATPRDVHLFSTIIKGSSYSSPSNGLNKDSGEYIDQMTSSLENTFENVISLILEIIISPIGYSFKNINLISEDSVQYIRDVVKEVKNNNLKLISQENYKKWEDSVINTNSFIKTDNNKFRIINADKIKKE